MSQVGGKAIFWFLAIATATALSPACGLVEEPSAGDGSGGASGGQPSTGGQPDGTGGESNGADACTGSFEEVNAIWMKCPNTVCQALKEVTCDPSDQGYPFDATSDCGDWARVRFDIGGTHGKDCFYHRGGLVAASASDDVPTFCDDTSFSITSDPLPTNWPSTEWSCPLSQYGYCEEMTVGGFGGAFDDVIVPEASCFDEFSRGCMPCCSGTPPDCADKPNGYPGYSCHAGGYCSCQCFGGEWSCAC